MCNQRCSYVFAGLDISLPVFAACTAFEASNFENSPSQNQRLTLDSSGDEGASRGDQLLLFCHRTGKRSLWFRSSCMQQALLCTVNSASLAHRLHLMNCRRACQWWQGQGRGQIPRRPSRQRSLPPDRGLHDDVQQRQPRPSPTAQCPRSPGRCLPPWRPRRTCTGVLRRFLHSR